MRIVADVYFLCGSPLVGFPERSMRLWKYAAQMRPGYQNPDKLPQPEVLCKPACSIWALAARLSSGDHGLYTYLLGERPLGV